MQPIVLSMRAVLFEVVIVVIAVGAAWGAFISVQWLLMLPEARIPVLPVILLAVMATRFATSGWLGKLRQRPHRD